MQLCLPTVMPFTSYFFAYNFFMCIMVHLVYYRLFSIDGDYELVVELADLHMF